MSCKDAVEILKQAMESYEPGSSTRKALEMAVVALELEDGNLYLRDVPQGVSIGIVRGTVYA